MPNIHADYSLGSLYYWQTHQGRIVDAFGENVLKYILQPGCVAGLGATAVDPYGWIATVVEAGAGTTEFVGSAVAGSVATITCAANEDDGGNYQLSGESFELTTDQGLVYAGLTCAINDVDQTDLFFGYAIADTTVLGGVSDAVYLECLDGAATVTAVTEKDSTETSTTSVGTMTDATMHTLELLYRGADDNVKFFFDGAEVATHTANIPDNEALHPTIAFLTGEAVANTCDIRAMRFIQIGR